MSHPKQALLFYMTRSEEEKLTTAVQSEAKLS